MTAENPEQHLAAQFADVDQAYDVDWVGQIVTAKMGDLCTRAQVILDAIGIEVDASTKRCDTIGKSKHSTNQLHG